MDLSKSLTLDEKVDWLVASMKGLRSDYQDLCSEISNLKVEVYRREAEMFRTRAFGGSPFKMEASAYSMGDSATDPSYDIFTDEDYGL